MHIAHFTNFYYPVVNGVVRSVSSFRYGLSELGHNVFVFAQQAPDYEDEEPFVFRYPAIKLPLQIDVPAAIPISPFIDRVLPPLKLDVIHTHHPFLLGQAGADKAEELGIPHVFTFHTRYRDYTHYFPIPQETVQEFVKSAIDNWLAEYMEKCHHVIVPSESIRAVLEDGYGLEDRVTSIPTGIRLEPYEQADPHAVRERLGWGDDRVLISVGRLAPEKNWKTLMEAAARVMETRKDLRLVLIGDGPSKEDLEAYADELGVGGQVEFTGKVPFEEIPAHLKAADLFVFASITETQGLVTMEAMAAGLPVVAVEASGTRETVTHMQDGILTANDSQALAAGLAQVLDDKDRYEKFCRAVVKKAQTFEIKVQSQRLVEVYQQAQEDRLSRGRIKLKKPHRLFKLDWNLLSTQS